MKSRVRQYLGRVDPDGGLVPFVDAIAALGHEGDMIDYPDDVPTERIVGTAGRSGDFDGRFRLVNRALLGRWRAVADAMDTSVPMPRVRLTRLGGLYFVVDGHHRVSVARARGQVSVPAQVRWICTTAYAMACLRLSHLPSKAAEREFLGRVPLPDDVRPDLWLDRPAEWMRLADAAEAWGFRLALRGCPVDRAELAARWWEDEVVPLVARLREKGAGVGLRDIELYAAALSLRDQRRHSDQPG